MPASQANQSDLQRVFATLRGILEPYIGRMRVFEDNDHSLYLNAPVVMPNGQPLFFASTAILRRQVSFHFQPLVLHPDLLDATGDLGDRMEGTSSFAFDHISREEIDALRKVVREGYQRFAADNDLPG
ncbi:MAG TPA: hypothetical protein VD767_08455 [Thermomicrobiales bacterium]|nr:hypothetical protein [Thermomicrobiales bacterium]